MAGNFARPRTVKAAVFILIGAFLIGMGGALVDLFALPEQTFVIALTLGIVALVLFILYKVWMGRNWARHLYAILTALGMLSVSIPQLLVTLNASVGRGALDGFLLAIQVVAIVMLYVRSSRSWFRSDVV